jgi:hypothetical protein
MTHLLQGFDHSGTPPTDAHGQTPESVLNHGIEMLARIEIDEKVLEDNRYT